MGFRGIDAVLHSPASHTQNINKDLKFKLIFIIERKDTKA